MKPITVISFLTVSWLLCTLTGQAQRAENNLDRPLRIEIPTQSDHETYRIIPLGPQGIILFYKSTETVDINSTKWYFSLFDQNLQQVWIKYAPIAASLNFKFSCQTGDTLNLYFEADRKSRNTDLSFQILRILKSGTLILNNGQLPESTTASFFEVIKQQAVLGLNSQDHHANILVMDLPKGEIRMLPMNSEYPETISFMTIDKKESCITTLLIRSISKKTTSLFFNKMTLDGKLILETQISNFNSNNLFIHVKEITTGPHENLIAGTYASGSYSSKKSDEGVSAGLFASPVISTIQTSMNFVNFLDLKNIQPLMGDRDILALRKKSMKKNRSGDNFSLDFSVLLHDLITWKDQIILTAETYYQQYHTETFTDYDFYGRPFTNSYTVFDGYQFAGVILTAFTKEGQLLWDNTMDIKDILTFDLEPKVALLCLDEDVVLIYPTQGKIAAKIIKGNETIEKTSYAELSLMHPSEKVVSASNEQIVYWYDHYFLCYGYQEIKDISSGNADKKMVFYCNKILFER